MSQDPFAALFSATKPGAFVDAMKTLDGNAAIKPWDRAVAPSRPAGGLWGTKRRAGVCVATILSAVGSLALVLVWMA